MEIKTSQANVALKADLRNNNVLLLSKSGQLINLAYKPNKKAYDFEVAKAKAKVHADKGGTSKLQNAIESIENKNSKKKNNNKNNIKKHKHSSSEQEQQPVAVLSSLFGPDAPVSILVPRKKRRRRPLMKSWVCIAGLFNFELYLLAIVLS